MSETRNQDKEITQAAITDLTAIPEELRQAEMDLSNFNVDLRTVKASLADAELDAQVNTVPDAKNAEGRKLQLEKAISESKEVKVFRERAAELEALRTGAEVRYNDLHRRWRSALAIIEFQTAKVTYLARYERTTK